MRDFSRSILLLSVGILALGPVHLASAQPAVVEGTVRTPTGTAVPYANVQIPGTTTGAATDAAGHFRFTTPQRGRITVRASAVGYRAAEQTVDVSAGDTTRVAITLRPANVEMDEAVVIGEAYSTGTSSQATLGPTEAVTTPGAQGDLFRALQSFPGVAAPGDGAGLFVRGGDVTETKTLIDQATVHHPYRYESPAGGSFGAVQPFLVDGTHFSTGGFSAQYGNALSGVLAMESQDRPTEAKQYVNLGLAAASVALDQPLIEDELGLRASGNRSFTGLLFRANGQRRDYVTVPQGVDGTVSLTWDSPGESSGQLKLLGFARHNRIGVETTQGAYAGTFRNRSTNHLYTLQWTVTPGPWEIQSSLSRSSYTSEKRFGVLDVSPTDAATALRVDATRNAERWTLRTGGTVEHRRYKFEGTVPSQPDVVSPGAPMQSLRESVLCTRSGGYGEVETSILSPLVARIGVRTDYQSRSNQLVVDPRAALAWRFSPQTRLRAAWGLYHQFPDLQTHGEHAGENVLAAQSAQHFVVGLRHERDDLLLRAEAYHKPYRNLVVRTGRSRYANAGSGVAQGLDLFGKYGAFLETRFNGWASYSLLRSHRTQPRDLGTDVQLESGPAPYDLTHQLTVVGKVRVIDQIRVGGTYRYTTGRPFTPVIGTVQRDSGGFLPIDGPIGSRRLPAYQRLDLQVSYYWPFNREQNVVFYAALNNALDRRNVVDVTYSPDYSERDYRTTDFRRSFYVGLTLTL